MARRGFVAVLAGRLLPMVPFVVLSYGAGLTAIRWAPYAAGTALGLVPSTVVQVGIGASAGAVVDRRHAADRRPAARRPPSSWPRSPPVPGTAGDVAATA